jgi:hypothetical protein
MRTTKKRPTAKIASFERTRAKVVARLVLKLRESALLPGLAQALEVGEIVCQALYDGDPRRCRRDGRHDPMFCRLASADGLPFSALTLSRFLDVYELYRRVGGHNFKQIGLSHYYAVLPLPPREQEMALVAACGNRWPATKLEAVVKRWRRDRG